LAALVVLVAHGDAGGCSRWCCYGGKQWLLLVSIFFFFPAAFCYLCSFPLFLCSSHFVSGGAAGGD